MIPVKGKLYQLREKRERPLWAYGPFSRRDNRMRDGIEDDYQLVKVPVGALLILVEELTLPQSVHYAETHWIKVIYQDLIGWMHHGFLNLGSLLDPIEDDVSSLRANEGCEPESSCQAGTE